MSEYDAVIAAVAAERVPDPRMGIFDIRVERRPEGIAVVGETTDPAAAAALIERLASASEPVLDEIVRLPDPGLGAAVYGLVRAGLAPVHGEPRVAASQVSQYILGQRIDLLNRRDGWFRVRGEDGYIGWIHHGYLLVGEASWAQAWERAEGGEPVVSLGAELVDEEGRPIATLPWGARVIRDSPGFYRLPDGRRGLLGSGELIDADRLVDRFPPRGESLTRSARRWIGTPYIWGGVTPAGADCSGFVQSVFWMHGVALPRDSDQQAMIGAVVLESAETGFRGLRPGDLLFFSERPGRITHVAISLGDAAIIHASLSNGGVEVNDLDGGLGTERRLREIFTYACRLLPD